MNYYQKALSINSAYTKGTMSNTTFMLLPENMVLHTSLCDTSYKGLSYIEAYTIELDRYTDKLIEAYNGGPSYTGGLNKGDLIELSSYSGWLRWHISTDRMTDDISPLESQQWAKAKMMLRQLESVIHHLIKQP